MLKTLYNTYLDVRHELRLAGVMMYQLEAKELVAFALGIPREQFNERDESMVFLKEQEKVESLLKLRLLGTPLPHILGEWDFYGLTFEVTTNTLIPRNDTECIAERGIEFLKKYEKAKFLDLCCGTGCIGIAMLKNLHDGIHGVMGDISDFAIRVAKNNITKHAVSARAGTMKINALEKPSEEIGRFQLIVCNPPYIPTEEIETLDIEVKDHEPILALDGGDDGLNFYRAVAENFRHVIVPEGALMFECGLGQYTDVMAIMQRAGYKELEIVKDLRGIERGIIGILK